MMIAYQVNGERVHVNDYLKGSYDVFCPQGHKVIAKQGTIKRWHFSHVGVSGCGHESGKTEWHMWWQDRIMSQYLEVRMKNDNTYHVADIVNQEGLVIEIQHSNIKKEDIIERETFYKNMIWIFDVTGGKVTIEKVHKDIMKLKVISSSFFLQAKKPCFLDLGHKGLIEIIKHKGSVIVGRKWTLQMIDNVYFRDILTLNADTRDEKPSYDISRRATKEEILKF